MRTEEIKIYKFEELSEEARNVAIENERNRAYKDHDFLCCFGDTCKDIARKNGFEDITLQYSLSYCQGDGLSFSGSINPEVLRAMFEKYTTKKRAQIIADNCEVVLKGNSGRYCYASTSDVDLYLSYSYRDLENVETIINSVLSDLEDKYVDLCGKLEKLGYDEIEYLTGEDAAKESLICNEYEFTEDGAIY